ncbi:unnamed protein product [Tenebrio molitor]|nr:unnamed protein product [Tenebrio molitor]
MTESGRDLKHQFLLFSRLHKTIALHQINKWFNQAKVFDHRITTADTELYFNNFNLPRLEFEDFEKFLHNLAEQKKVFMSELAWKLVSCGIPDPVKMNRVIYVRWSRAKKK